MPSPKPPTAPASASLAASLASLPATERAVLLAELSDEEALALLYDWRFWARPSQLAPSGEWLIWLILAGRGWGKTRTGAEFIRDFLTSHPGSRAALVAATFADGRDAMVEGTSGLLSVIPPWQLRGGSLAGGWNRSLGELILANESRAKIYSSERADQLRGPQHDVAWADEAAKFRDAHLGRSADTTWSNLMFSLRAGDQPRCVVTTTPKPLRLIRELAGDPATVLVRGTSYENLANLAPTFKAQILDSYEGTRLGRQELYAELLDDVPGALWSRAALDGLRRPAAPALRRVVVAIDPAVSASDESSETGIIVAGVGRDGHGYVLADATIKASPASWAGRAIDCYRRYRADRIIAEVNNGGDLVEATIRSVDASVPYKAVHASRGKHTRAEPVAALYERGLIHHVGDTGSFEALEDQMCNWLPDPGVPSPDRMDALVWALTELMLTLVAQSYRVVVVPEDDRDISPI